MVQAHGMIDGCAEPLDDRDPSAGIDHSPENYFLKQIRREVLGTRERQEKSAWMDMLEGMKI
jgi:hypothetical protein